MNFIRSNKTHYFYLRLNKWRRIVQILSVLFFILVPVLILLDVRFILGNLYSISFWDLEIVDPAMAIQTLILSKTFLVSLFAAALIPIVIAFIFGRVFCSWVCPYNSLSEFLEYTENKIRHFVKRKRKPVQGKNPKPYFYWLIFISVLLITFILSFPLIVFLSFPGILTAQAASVIMGSGVGLLFFFPIIIAIFELAVSKRFWCKYVCPVGASLALFRIPNTMHIEKSESKCDCAGIISPCSNECPLGLKPEDKNLYPYCFNCGRCIKVCEKTGNKALFFSFKQK